MNTIGIYRLQIAIISGISLVLVTYFRPYLKRIMLDRCGTQEHANFWVVFSSILLADLPLIFGKGYNPPQNEPGMLLFDATHQVRLNLLGFLLALLGIGCAVSFFALLAPSPAVN